MKGIIAKLLREDKLCSVFTNDAEKYMAGYLLDSDGEYMLMELLNPYGYSDGLCCQRIESVTKVETDTLYNEDLELLAGYRRQTRRQKIERQGNVLDAFLTEALHGKKLCTVELYDSGCDDVIGFLTEIDGEELVFAMLDEHGNPDGKTVFERSSISSIKFESEDEEKIVALFRVKSAKEYKAGEKHCG